MPKLLSVNALQVADAELEFYADMEQIIAKYLSRNN